MADEPSPDDLPPAYFLSLTVENVRCFGPEQTLDLSDGDGSPAQWTVLLGDNGTGKTTLLQALSALEVVTERDGEAEELLGNTLSDGEPVWSERPAILILQDREASADFRRSSEEKATFSAGYFSGAKLSADSGGSALPRQFELTQRGVKGLHAEGYPPSDEVKGLFCVGYGASRAMQEGETRKEEKVKTLSLFLDTGSLPNAEEWLHNLNYAAESGKEKARTRLNKVVSVLSDPDKGILPDVDDLRFQESEDDTSPPDVEFRTHYGWVTIDQLSLGYRTMIAWVVDLARRLFNRYPESENPLAEPAVCLVDEIDLHLHPKWQRKIIDFLSERFPNTQFIVTAHSPLVVQAAEDANIALLKRVEVEDGDDYVEIENDPARIRNWRVDQILTSDLFNLNSARPPKADKLMQEREEILAKEELTDEDKERLDEIEEEMGDLPTGETPDDIEAMNLIRQAARRIKGDG
jgi:energy-coupling factor transporter ATP-binding protein EcfA2